MPFGRVSEAGKGGTGVFGVAKNAIVAFKVYILFLDAKLEFGDICNNSVRINGFLFM